MSRKVKVTIEGFYELPADLQPSYKTDDPDVALEIDCEAFNDDPFSCIMSLVDDSVTVRLELSDA